MKSVRGPGGGYLLAKDAETISVAEIVRAVEDDDGRGACKPYNPRRCHCMASNNGSETQCLTHGLWLALGNQLESFLGGVSLDDVLNGGLEPQSGAGAVYGSR